MDREGFRNRLNQYKKAREENPGLKYWEWKDIPKYDEGTNGVTLKEKEDAFWRGDTQKMAELVEREGKQLTYVTPQSNMDEVVITANKPKQNQYSELDFAKDVAGFVPVLGDVVDIYDAGKSLYNGNYSQAALLGAGLLLPNWLEKGGKYLYKGIRNNWRRFKRNFNMPTTQNNNYMLGERISQIANRIAHNEVRKSGIAEYVQTPFFDKNSIEQAKMQYANAQQRNAQSAKEAIKKVQLRNIGKFTPSQLKEINEIFKEDPRYADFISSHPELNPLDIETVDRFVTKQNSFIRGVYSDQDNDELIKSMMTENISDSSKKKGGDRLGTNATGIYVSNSGEIADRFQRTSQGSVRSDIALLHKKAATDINTPIKERLAAERRRIFPYDIVPGSDKLSYQSLVDLGYVAKEAQYTTRLGNKLPGYERAYISKELDIPNLEINDLQTTKTNLKDKKGRWGIGGVQSVPELEDQLFDGLNIGTSYGDFLHFMRALKSPNLTISKYNKDYGDKVYDKRIELHNLFTDQVNKHIAIKNKILKNPYLKTAQNVYLNRAPIFGISGTLGITGASIYGIMNSPWAKSRDRFSDAMDDDEFAEYFRKSSISANDYSSSTDYINAIIEEWNKQNPNKQFAEGGEVESDPLEVLERSKPKVAGIPINDKPLSGTDPIGEAMMWGLGGGAASVALRSLFPTYGATAGWLAFGDNNKENVLIVPNNVNKSKLPVAKDLVNYDVKEFFENDVVPRDVIYPIESKQSFLNDANFMYDIYPESHFEQNVAGYYDNINKKVVVNNLYAGDQKSINRIGTHEFGHKYNDQFELDDPHKRILNNAYTVEENKIGRTARGARRTNEKRETNKNIRYDMYVELQEKLGRSPSPSEVDDFIDSLSDREILRRVRNSNMYGSAYFESINERAQRIKQPIGTYTRTRASKIRKALKQVAMNERSKDNQNYA